MSATRPISLEVDASLTQPLSRSPAWTTYPGNPSHCPSTTTVATHQRASGTTAFYKRWCRHTTSVLLFAYPSVGFRDGTAGLVCSPPFLLPHLIPAIDLTLVILSLISWTATPLLVFLCPLRFPVFSLGHFYYRHLGSLELQLPLLGTVVAL